jgi:hypothetical protein
MKNISENILFFVFTLLFVSCGHRYSNKSLADLYFIKDTLALEDYDKLNFSITKDSINSYFKSSGDTTYSVFTKENQVVAKSLSVKGKQANQLITAFEKKYNVCISATPIPPANCLDKQNFTYLPMSDTLQIWKSYFAGKPH